MSAAGDIRLNTRRANIVAQLIQQFCADDHNCKQRPRKAYNESAERAGADKPDSPATQFLTRICAKRSGMNSLCGCLK
jgi:hypothetical protein